MAREARREADRVKLYVVTFKLDDEFWTEPYMAEDHDHAEEQCNDANPPEITIVCTARIPFYMVERAYYLERASFTKKQGDT
jgi:hypothetical protein